MRPLLRTQARYRRVGGLPAEPAPGAVPSVAPASARPPAQPSLEGQGATPGAGPEASGALRLLRYHRELAAPPVLPPSGRADLEAMARPPLPQGPSVLGLVCPAHGPIPVATRQSRPFSISSRSKPVTRGAGCVKGARPDLWEAGVGNGPGPPGGLAARRRARTACQRDLELMDPGQRHHPPIFPWIAFVTENWIGPGGTLTSGW